MKNLRIYVALILNMRGNIASIHWYHRQRVTEKDRRPFGKLVGLGTMVIGVSLVVFGALSFAADLGLSFFAMIQYNKGIF